MVTRTKKSVKTKKAFDYKTIKSFKDACRRLKQNPLILPEVSLLSEEFRKPMIAYYKLVLIFKAINNGWIPNWNNWSQYKYYPWYRVLSSGFGFVGSAYDGTTTGAGIGSRLCTESSQTAIYIAKQFEDEHKDFLLYSK
jgi:hypothetical protein